MRRPTIHRVSTALGLPQVVVQTRLTNSLKRFAILFPVFVWFKALRTVAGRGALAHILLDLRPALRYSYVGGATEGRANAADQRVDLRKASPCCDRAR